MESDREETTLGMRPSEIITTSDKSNPIGTELSILEETSQNKFFSRSVTHTTTLTRMSTDMSEKSQLC